MLEQWGVWSRQGNGHLAAHGVMFGSTVPEPNITDDLALVIDSLLAHMARREPNLYRAVWNYHLGNLTDVKLAARLNVPYDTARHWRVAGERWMDGCLTGVALAG